MTVTRSNILKLPPPLPPELPNARAERPGVLFGSLDVVSAFDLLEWLCSNRRTLALHVLAPGLTGHVVVENGELVDARCGGLQGLPALTEIVGCPRGQFELVQVAATAQPTLQGRWQALLLSAAQQLDEREFELASRTTTGPEPRAAPVPPAGPPGREPRTSVETLIDRGFAALRDGNRAEARRCWSAALAMTPGDRMLQFNLRKLDNPEPAKRP